jgi:hypothetical protein
MDQKARVTALVKLEGKTPLIMTIRKIGSGCATDVLLKMKNTGMSDGVNIIPRSLLASFHAILMANLKMNSNSNSLTYAWAVVHGDWVYAPRVLADSIASLPPEQQDVIKSLPVTCPEFVWVALDGEWCSVPKPLADSMGWNYKSDVPAAFIRNIPVPPADLRNGQQLAKKPVAVKFECVTHETLKGMGAAKQAFIRQAVNERIAKHGLPTQGLMKVSVPPKDLFPGQCLSREALLVRFEAGVDEKLQALKKKRQGFIRQAVEEKLKAKEQGNG